MQVEATALVSREMAESFPSHPERVREVALEAEAAMREKAAERNRHLSAAPRLDDMRDTALGFVELRFVADTESD